MLHSIKMDVLWNCDICGGEYLAPANEMADGTYTCPYCDNRRLLPGFNSLANRYPDIAKHWSSNNEKTADQVLSDVTVLGIWTCPDCHGEYNAYINEVVSGEYTCPYCNNRKVLPGFNSLADRHPDIAKHWSPNNEKIADQVLPGVASIAIWTCPDCHGEYTAPINEMVSGEYSCPYCNNRKVLPGFNSLAVRKPDLLNEWSYLNNYLLADPDHILPSSTVPVWWQCPSDEKHVYPMSPASRLLYQKRKREPCLYCKGRRRKKRHFV